MKSEHPIADEVLDLVTIALSKGEHYMAYNNSLYFIDKDDVHFFRTQEEANDFSTAISVTGTISQFFISTQSKTFLIKSHTAKV